MVAIRLNKVDRDTPFGEAAGFRNRRRSYRPGEARTLPAAEVRILLAAGDNRRSGRSIRGSRP